MGGILDEVRKVAQRDNARLIEVAPEVYLQIAAEWEEETGLPASDGIWAGGALIVPQSTGSKANT